MSEPHRLVDQAAALGVGLPPGAATRLLRFEELLVTRAISMGLVARSDAGRMRERHILDGLRAAAVVGPEDSAAYDLGSGAGLPGIVVAIARPPLRVRLVERRRRRAGFLELAVETLRLDNADVFAGRIEDLGDPVDLCFARALGPPEEAWRLAEPLLRPTGRLVYFAGARGGAGISVRGARVVEVLGPPRQSVLESAGPLVIMAR